MQRLLLAFCLVFLPLLAGGGTVTQESIFWPTTGTGDGVATGYPSDDWQWFNRMTWLNDPTTQGVSLDYLNSLVVTNPAGVTLRVASGGAIVYGFPYRNTTDVDFTLTTPVIGTTGWRLVLQADWATQEVRLAVLESADGVLAAPGLTQTPGVRWEITLRTGTITTVPAVTIVAGQSWLEPGISIGSGHIQNRTRRMFVSSNRATNFTDTTVIDRTTTLGLDFPDLKVCWLNLWFAVPADYSSNMEVTVVVQPKTNSGNVWSRMQADFGACGEAVNAHNLQPAAAAVAVTGDIQNCIDTLVLTGVAAGDLVNLHWVRFGDNVLDTVGETVYVQGIYIDYTAVM